MFVESLMEDSHLGREVSEAITPSVDPSDGGYPPATKETFASIAPSKSPIAVTIRVFCHCSFIEKPAPSCRGSCDTM